MSRRPVGGPQRRRRGRSRHRMAGAAAVLLIMTVGCAPSRSGALGPAPTAPAPATTASAPAVPIGPSTAAASPAATAASTADISASPPPGAGPATSPRHTNLTLELWYVRHGRLAPTRRTRPTTVATSRLALTELVAGPSPAEATVGLVTLLPAGVEVSRIAAGVAVVRMPDAPDPSTGRLREAQVVYTLTQFPTVRQVAFGTAAPAGRGDYADLLPAIVVTHPVIGDRVTSPVTVTGNADVFEATVSVRILDAAGRQLATAFTTATCGIGCRGDYRLAVGYRLAREQPGTIEAYEVSGADGSRTKLVSVPVTLAATQ
ncbi:Gmad2 immunoglobulin-like domain-containing protein [Micromonospora sp. NPDC051196]|uniref:Gmad2 immunoglobulin-like domain-containing protein n=1 Tax=Micromonospora sp. NPDC051196 TaxID=3155281 RepID=UPI003429CEA5